MLIRYVCNSAAGLLKWPFQNRYNFLATTVGSTAIFATRHFAQSPYHIALLTGLMTALTLANRFISHQNKKLSQRISELQNSAEIADRASKESKKIAFGAIFSTLLNKTKEEILQYPRSLIEELCTHFKPELCPNGYSSEQFLKLWDSHPNSVDDRLTVFLKDLPFLKPFCYLTTAKFAKEYLQRSNPGSGSDFPLTMAG